MRLRYLQHIIHPADCHSFPSDIPDWMEDVRRFCLFWFSAEECWEARTSGSVSTPGIIQLSRAQMEFSARKSLDYFHFSSAANHGFALAIPASAAGGFMLLARAFLADMDVLLLPPSSLASGENLFPADKKWFLPLLPLQFYDFLMRKDASELSIQLSGILLGGGMLEHQLSGRISKLECPVFHSYGMTETASHIAVQKIHPEPETGFRPLPGFEVRLNGEECLEVSAGIITGHQWLSTRDRAEILPDGSFRVLGRVDFTINSGGLKIQPETEKRQLQVMLPSGLQNFDLLGIPDTRLGEKLVMAAYCPDSEKSVLQNILNGITGKDQRRRLPKAIFCFPEGPPRLPGGKTDYRKLRMKIMDNLAGSKSS